MYFLNINSFVYDYVHINVKRSMRGVDAMVHVAVNKYYFEKNQHFRVRFWGGGGGHQKAYAVYAFINVDNCERPLSKHTVRTSNSETNNRDTISVFR